MLVSGVQWSVSTIVVQPPSHAWLFATPWTVAFRPRCSSHLPVFPSSCSLHQWCHPAISSSDALFSFCPQSFPALGPFPTSCLFASGDQSTGASVSVLPVNIQGWAPLKLTGLISLLSKELSGVFSSTTVWRHQFFGVLPSLRSSSRCVRDLWEDHSLNHKDLCWQSNVSASQLTV